MPRQILWTFVLFITLLFAATGGRAAPIPLDFAISSRADGAQLKASLYLKRLVEQRADNRIILNLLHFDPSNGAENILDSLKANRIQMAALQLSKLKNLSPELQIFEMPFIFQNSEHLQRVITGEIGQQLLERAHQEKIKALAFWDNGFLQFTANTPLISALDMEGMRVGIAGTADRTSLVVALGAQPILTTEEARYKRLATGEIDAQEGSLALIDRQKLTDVQSQLTLSNHRCIEDIIWVNESFWKKTPKDLQVILQGALKKAAAYYQELTSQSNTNALKQIRQSGAMKISRLTSQQKAQWQAEIIRRAPKTYQGMGKNWLKRIAAEKERSTTN